MPVRNSGNATSRQRSKGLNINCVELFSPPVLLPGTASQVQGSRRSPVECSVSITGTSHGAVTREAAGHPPFFWPPTPCRPASATHKHIYYIYWEIYKRSYTPAAATVGHMCVISEEARNVFFSEGLKQSRGKNVTRSHLKFLSSIFPSYLNFCINWTCILQELPGLNQRWQLLSRWALNTGLTPAVFEACRGLSSSDTLNKPAWEPLISEQAANDWA